MLWWVGAMTEQRVGVFGATGLVGECLVPLLRAAGWSVTAWSSNGRPDQSSAPLPYWICAAPLWVLPEYFEVLLQQGARRVVVLSSTSASTKADSNDPEERVLAARLCASEQQLRDWAECHGVVWVILRSTLIYGRGKDKNISEMARLIRRWGFFPLLGHAQGLRQPVHAEDVAAACVAALQAPRAENRSYVLSGGESLTYREMVVRVFTALGRPPRCFSVPLGVFILVLKGLRRLPRYRHWTAAMALRMGEDLIFDHSEAQRDLGFVPRVFRLTGADLP